MNHSCPRIIDLLVDYLEGELSAEEAARLEAHLGDCPPCLVFLEKYRNTGPICKKAIEKAVPKAMEGTLIAFLKEKIQSQN